MNKVLNKIFAFFSNRWTKLGFSVLSVGYGMFLFWVARLTVTCYLSTENPPALFLVYAFINVMFAIVMIYTRKSLMTQIVAMLMHPCILVMLVFGFGNWFLIFPPLVTATVIFLASGANETLKVVLGTVYIIVFVLAVLGYLTLEKLTIPIPGKMDFSRREYPSVTVDYHKGNDEELPYRVVMYVDDASKENRVANYYVERAELDKSYWILNCEYVWGSSHIGAIRIDQTPDIKWKDKNILLFNGDFKEINSEGKAIAADDENEVSGNKETTLIPEPSVNTGSASANTESPPEDDLPPQTIPDMTMAPNLD